MPFITQGKTNLKYILIIAILTILAGGGILWITLTQEGPPSPFFEIKKPADETADRQTYRNEEYGFEFKYPKDWGDITLKSQKDSEVYTFNSPKEAIEAIWYHKPSQVIVFIMRGEKYELVYGGENYQDILKVIYPNKEIKTIYTVSQSLVSWNKRIDNVNISPNGKYISFMLSAHGYKNSGTPRPIMINIETGRDIILESGLVRFDDPEKSIYWSPNNEVLAIKSETSEFGGSNCGIYVSDYGEPEKLHLIFLIPWERHIQGIHIGIVQFVDDEKLYFEVGEGIEKYIYNTRTEELKETK